MKTDDPSYLLRIDKATGRTVWRVERPTSARFESPDSYTTPALLRYGTTATEIVVTGGDAVTGRDLWNGKELWRANGFNPDDDGSSGVVASPVRARKLIVAPTATAVLAEGSQHSDVTRYHTCSESFGSRPDMP